MAEMNSISPDYRNNSANSNNASESFYYEAHGESFSCNFTVRQKDDAPHIEYDKLDIGKRQKMTEILWSLDLPLAQYFVAEFGQEPNKTEIPLIQAIHSTREGAISSMKSKLKRACTYFNTEVTEGQEITSNYQEIVSQMQSSKVTAGNHSDNLWDRIADETRDVLSETMRNT